MNLKEKIRYKNLSLLEMVFQIHEAHNIEQLSNIEILLHNWTVQQDVRRAAIEPLYDYLYKKADVLNKTRGKINATMEGWPQG